MIIKTKGILTAAKEVFFAILSYVVLLLLWVFVLNDVTLSDEGLTAIGMAVSTSLGLLTAIVVSFVLVIWQSSRQERSASYWRWHHTLLELSDIFDRNLELVMEIAKDVMKLTWEASAAALVAPMPRARIKELANKILAKSEEKATELMGIKNPTPAQTTKAKAYRDIQTYIVSLVTANFEHNVAHYLYRRILSLRQLLYRLLASLLISILIVSISVTTVPSGISDLLNAPLAVILILWVFYVLIRLGKEIKRVSLLEDEFRRQEGETKDSFNKSQATTEVLQQSNGPKPFR